MLSGTKALPNATSQCGVQGRGLPLKSKNAWPSCSLLGVGVVTIT